MRRPYSTVEHCHNNEGERDESHYLHIDARRTIVFEPGNRDISLAGGPEGQIWSAVEGKGKEQIVNRVQYIHQEKMCWL